MGIDLARGFGPWKEMFVKNEHKVKNTNQSFEWT